MKRALHGLGILVFSALLAGPALTGQAPERPGGLAGWIALLPADDEIPGWKRSAKLVRASQEEELYRIFNGGASLFIRHGFRSFWSLSYRGPQGKELEVQVFDQGDPRKAEGLFEDPLGKPGRAQALTGLGEKARIDLTPFFATGVDFIRNGIFVRVVIQDKSEEGLNTALSFARAIAEKIP